MDVRLEALSVFNEFGSPWSTKNTYIFDGNGIELTDGQRREIRGESIVRRETPFHDPYRGVRMEMVDCVESPAQTVIEVLIDTTLLAVDPPIVAHLYGGYTTGTITVTNGGTATVGVGSVAIGGRHPDAFSLLSNECGQLEPGVSCAIVVSYDGGIAGNPNHHAVLKIPNDDGLAPQLSVSLFGEVGVPADVNRRPTAVEILPDRSLALDGTLNVDVSGAFVDPDGDALTYTVSSSAPQVVAARAAGALLTLTASGVGAATIRVTATDAGSLSATQSFTVTVSMMASGTFTDDPIQPGVTPVKAIHFTELRTRIDALRRSAGLPAFPWTDPVLTPGVTPVKLVHLAELREALAAAYAGARRSVPIWTDAAPSGRTPIRAAHVTELRAAVSALE